MDGTNISPRGPSTILWALQAVRQDGGMPSSVTSAKDVCLLQEVGDKLRALRTPTIRPGVG